MHYLLLLANDPDAWDDPDAGADDGVIEDWTAYTEALAAAGVLVSGAALHASGTATAVRRRDGRALPTDGPWAETKEHPVGFYAIDAPDLDVALGWEARMPNVCTGTVEVRPIRDTSLADAARECRLRRTWPARHGPSGSASSPPSPAGSAISSWPRTRSTTPSRRPPRRGRATGCPTARGRG